MQWRSAPHQDHTCAVPSPPANLAKTKACKAYTSGTELASPSVACNSPHSYQAAFTSKCCVPVCRDPMRAGLGFFFAKAPISLAAVSAAPPKGRRAQAINLRLANLAADADPQPIWATIGLAFRAVRIGTRVPVGPSKLHRQGNCGKELRPALGVRIVGIPNDQFWVGQSGGEITTIGLVPNYSDL